MKTFFNCSQKKLFETIENLFRQEEITGYLWGMPDIGESIGDYRLEISKAYKRQGAAGARLSFEKIGWIKIGAINDDLCLLKARDGNPEIRQFYDYLMDVLRGYLPLHVTPAEMPQAELIQVYNNDEKDVSELSAKHLTIRAIAFKTGMSTSKVKRIRKKLGIRYRKL